MLLIWLAVVAQSFDYGTGNILFMMIMTSSDFLISLPRSLIAIKQHHALGCVTMGLLDVSSAVVVCSR